MNGNKYLTLVPTDESKEKMKKYDELWIKIRDLFRLIKKKLDYYEKYVKIKFDSDNKFPITKTRVISIVIPITIVVRAVFDGSN